MKLEINRYYRTRDGQKAFVAARRDDIDLCDAFVGWVIANRQPVAWSDNGEFYSTRVIESHLDLVAEWREPVKVHGWVNVYGDSKYPIFFFETKEHADKVAAAMSSRIACIEVSGEEK